ncbi:hypothetical protein NFJ02_14g15760 [Pycnococcus provasolii]
MISKKIIHIAHDIVDLMRTRLWRPCSGDVAASTAAGGIQMYDRDLTLTLLKKLVSTDYATLNALQIDDAHDNVKTLIHACVEAAAALWLS